MAGRASVPTVPLPGSSAFQVHVSGGEPEHRSPVGDEVAGAPGAGMPKERAVRWWLLRYRRGPKRSGDRAALWRELQTHQAVKLRQGMWALRHDEHDGPPELASLGLLVQSDPEVSLAEVCRDDPDQEHLEQKLAVACERVWDAFFNEANRVVDSLARREEATEVAMAVEQMRSQYRRALRLDLLQAGTGRATHRLQECEAVVSASYPDIARCPMGVRHRVTTIVDCDAWVFDDTCIRYIVTVEPVLTLSLELAYRRFETTVFRRAPVASLHGGLFDTMAERGSRDHVLRRLDERLRLFALSLG